MFAIARVQKPIYLFSSNHFYSLFRNILLNGDNTLYLVDVYVLFHLLDRKKKKKKKQEEEVVERNEDNCSFYRCHKFRRVIIVNASGIYLGTTQLFTYKQTQIDTHTHVSTESMQRSWSVVGQACTNKLVTFIL